jgi:hypothetical protein
VTGCEGLSLGQAMKGKDILSESRFRQSNNLGIGR